jgi:arylsulfatase A-like enzyme
VIRGQKKTLYPFVVGYFRDSQKMIRQPPWKLIQYRLVGKTQLFNLDNDPLEQVNLAGDPGHQPIVDELSDQLDRWMRDHAKAIEK